MAVVNKFNVNKQQVTLDADIIENMSANDVSYNDSFQYDENTVGDKLSKLGSEVIYDVTANNNGATFASLSVLLSSENLSTLIPTSVRHGGMSIQFVQSSDKKYVQYRHMSSSTSVADFTNPVNWKQYDEIYDDLGAKETGCVNQEFFTKSVCVADIVETVSGYINVSTGEYVSNSKYKCSQWIDCSNFDIIIAKNVYSGTLPGGYWYGEGKLDEKIQPCTLNGTVVIKPSDVPAGAKYLRLSWKPDTTSEVAVYTLINKYIKENVDVEISSFNLRVVDLENNTISSKTELYDTYLFNTSGYINIDNDIASNSVFCYTDYIDIDILGDNDIIDVQNLKTGQHFRGGYYYNSSKEIIGNIAATSLHERKSNFPIGTKYLRFNYASDTPVVINIIRSANSRFEGIDDRVTKIDTIIPSLEIETGYCLYMSDGDKHYHPNYSVIKYFEVTGSKSVYSKDSPIGRIGSTVARIAFYDSNYSYIENSATLSKYADVPSNAVYARCTIDVSVTEPEVILFGVSALDKVNKVQENVNLVFNAIDTGLKGKTVAFIGDSITQGGGYLNTFAELAQCTAINLGMNSTCYANNTSNNMGAHRFITRATQENLANVDMVVIFGGTNDFSCDTKAIGDLFVEETITAHDRVGNKKLVPPTDTDAFAAAVHELILQVRSIIGEKPIVLMTPLNRGRYAEGRPITSECNANGDYLFDFVNAIKEIGRFYAIPVFDSGGVLNLDPTDRQSSDYFGDLLHPNSKGSFRLGKLLYKWVCQNIVLN